MVVSNLPNFQPQKHEKTKGFFYVDFDKNGDFCVFRVLRGKIVANAQKHEDFFIKFDNLSNILWGTL